MAASDFFEYYVFDTKLVPFGDTEAMAALVVGLVAARRRRWTVADSSSSDDGGDDGDGGGAKKPALSAADQRVAAKILESLSTDVEEFVCLTSHVEPRHRLATEKTSAPGAAAGPRAPQPGDFGAWFAIDGTAIGHGSLASCGAGVHGYHCERDDDA
jgi:hypothetical protein